MNHIFTGGLGRLRKVMIAEGTPSAAQAKEGHGYLRFTYGSVLLNMRPGMELGMEPFVEGFGAATGNTGRSRVKLDAVAQLY